MKKKRIINGEYFLGDSLLIKSTPKKKDIDFEEILDKIDFESKAGDFATYHKSAFDVNAFLADIVNDIMSEIFGDDTYAYHITYTQDKTRVYIEGDNLGGSPIDLGSYTDPFRKAFSNEPPKQNIDDYKNQVKDWLQSKTIDLTKKTLEHIYNYEKEQKELAMKKNPSPKVNMMTTDTPDLKRLDLLYNDMKKTYKQYEKLYYMNKNHPNDYFKKVWNFLEPKQRKRIIFDEEDESPSGLSLFEQDWDEAKELSKETFRGLGKEEIGNRLFKVFRDIIKVRDIFTTFIRLNWELVKRGKELERVRKEKLGGMKTMLMEMSEYFRSLNPEEYKALKVGRGLISRDDLKIGGKHRGKIKNQIDERVKYVAQIEYSGMFMEEFGTKGIKEGTPYWFEDSIEFGKNFSNPSKKMENLWNAMEALVDIVGIDSWDDAPLRTAWMVDKDPIKSIDPVLKGNLPIMQLHTPQEITVNIPYNDLVDDYDIIEFKHYDKTLSLSNKISFLQYENYLHKNYKIEGSKVFYDVYDRIIICYKKDEFIDTVLEFAKEKNIDPRNKTFQENIQYVENYYFDTLIDENYSTLLDNLENTIKEAGFDNTEKWLQKAKKRFANRLLGD